MPFNMKRSSIMGCCVSNNFYDIGAAHGQPKAQSLEEFADKIIDLGYAVINTAITNNVQTREREFLEACGFKQAFHEPNRGLYLHTASSLDLNEALKPFIEKRVQRLKEKQEKEKKEREERERVRLEQQAERDAARAASIKNISKNSLEFFKNLDHFKTEDVRQLWEIAPDVNPEQFVAEELVIPRLPYRFRKSDVRNPYSNAAALLVRTINYRLEKRRKEEKKGTKST